MVIILQHLQYHQIALFYYLLMKIKLLFAPHGICVESMIIPLDRADDRNFVMNMYASDNFFTRGRFEYSVKDNILYFRDCACNFGGNSSTKPWVSIYTLYLQ